MTGGVERQPWVAMAVATTETAGGASSAEPYGLSN